MVVVGCGDVSQNDWRVRVGAVRNEEGEAMRVGFTGTSAGLTNDQLIQVHMLLGDLKTSGATQATHGMCIGADDQFHEQARGFGYFIIGVPGVNAYGDVYKRATCVCDLVMPPRPFLIRNRDLVSESDVVIACPRETIEQFRGSGTWATIRYARRAKKPLVIVWPDGSGRVEHVANVRTLEEYRVSLTNTAIVLS